MRTVAGAPPLALEEIPVVLETAWQFVSTIFAGALLSARAPNPIAFPVAWQLVSITVRVPVLAATAATPVDALWKARQLVSVKFTGPEPSDSAWNPLLQSEAVQLLIIPVAATVPGAPRNTPFWLHSVILESCETR